MQAPLRLGSGFALTLLLIILALSAWSAPAPASRKAIYPEDGKGMDRVQEALADAQREHKRVLLMTGGNWCGWCHLLHGVLEQNDTLRPLLQENYVLVMIDSRADKTVLDKWNIVPQGVPFLTVLDEDGRKLVDQETGALEDGPRHDPKRVAFFLEKWAPAPAKAADVLSSALVRAKAENKKAFVRVGAPSCGWCRRMDAYVTEPEIAAILNKDFVIAKIDADRNPGADATIAKIRKAEEGAGIPWFAFLDGDGNILVTSTIPGSSNIGFPQEPVREIPYFKAMLEKVKVNMTEADIARLVNRLTEIREAREAAAKAGR